MRWARRHRLAQRLAEVRAAPERDVALRDLAARFFAPDFWIWLRRNVTPDEMVDRLAATDLTERSIFATLLVLYGERRGASDANAVLGEKTPAHLRDVPRLNEWFPDARFIHTFRDPRGIYASELRRLKQGRWGPKARMPWVPGAVIDPFLGPLEAMSTARAWHDAARLHRRYERLLGERYRLVRFEDLISSPEREVRAICEFLDIPFDVALLEGVDVVGSSFEDRRHAASGFDPSAAERWRRELHPMARAWFSMSVGAQLGEFGYLP